MRQVWHATETGINRRSHPEGLMACLGLLSEECVANDRRTKPLGMRSVAVMLPIGLCQLTRESNSSLTGYMASGGLVRVVQDSRTLVGSMAAPRTGH